MVLCYTSQDTLQPPGSHTIISVTFAFQRSPVDRKASMGVFSKCVTDSSNQSSTEAGDSILLAD